MLPQGSEYSEGHEPAVPMVIRAGQRVLGSRAGGADRHSADLLPAEAAVTEVLTGVGQGALPAGALPAEAAVTGALTGVDRRWAGALPAKAAAAEIWQSGARRASVRGQGVGRWALFALIWGLVRKIRLFCSAWTFVIRAGGCRAQRDIFKPFCGRWGWVERLFGAAGGFRLDLSYLPGAF